MRLLPTCSAKESRLGTPPFAQTVQEYDAAFAAAEPLARLIDTAYLGRLGANALGGAGAAIAAQYSVSKLYNDPLLRTTISIVAAQEGAEPEERANAVSTALLLALVVGVIQGTAFFLLAGPVLRAIDAVIRRTSTNWDDIIVERRVLHRLAHLVPGLVIYRLAGLALTGHADILEMVNTGAQIYLVLSGMLVVDALMSAGVEIYRSTETSREISCSYWNIHNS